MAGLAVVAFLQLSEKSSLELRAGIDRLANITTNLKPIHECLPVKLGSSDAAVPSMVILPTVIGKQSKLVPDLFSRGRLRHRLEIVTELFFKTHRRSVSSVEIDKDEPLGCDVGMDLEKRMSLGIKVRQASVLSGFVQFTSWEVRPCSPRVQFSISSASISTFGFGRTEYSPAVKSTCEYRARPASLLRHRVTPVSADVVERVDVAVLVSDHEEVPPKHLAMAQLLASLYQWENAYFHCQVITCLLKPGLETRDMPQLQ